jgi:bacterioferritin (cytochrome b1)
MFKKVQEVVGTALGDEALAAAPYGLHGARVEGWNATRAHTHTRAHISTHTHTHHARAGTKAPR